MSRIAACVVASLLPVGAAFADYALGPISNLVVKNPIASTNQFGYGSTTGDIDGDGIDDLIVAARRYASCAAPPG